MIKIVEFHLINRVITAETILFTISLIIMAIGVLFHSDKTLLTYTFIYGLGLFGIFVITIFVGALMGARGGNLQNRFNEIQITLRRKSEEVNFKEGHSKFLISISITCIFSL